jgi:hypothetical protein
MYKLSSAYYTVSTVKGIVTQETLRMISFSCVYCVMTHSIIFRGNLPYRINITRIKKRIISIIMNSSNRDSCRELFRNLKICIHSTYFLFSFVVKNKDQYKYVQVLYPMVVLPAMDSLIINKYNTNQDIYSINLRHPISYLATLYCIVFLFSPNIIHMIVDSSVCNIF